MAIAHGVRAIEVIQREAPHLDAAAEVREIGRLIAEVMAGPMGDLRAGSLEDYVEHAARKRIGFVVEPDRVSSWDHAKLLPAG